MSTTYRSAEAFPPGEYLREELDERGWTVTEFAQILDRPLQAVSEILNGHKEITPDTAIDIADALGTSPELWLGLQATYKLHKARGERSPSAVERRSRLRAFGPITEMQRRGWITNTKDVAAIEADVTAMFEIDSINATPAFAIAARRSNTDTDFTPTQLAWLARVRSVARTMTVADFDATALRAFAERLPGALADGPGRLIEIESALAACGVAFVFEPSLRSSKLDGAVVFTSDSVPVIALTGRFDRFDIFLFTLLHECAHLILGHVTVDTRPLIDEASDAETTKSDIEIAADRQATKWLFPDGFDQPEGRITVGTVAQLAARHNVHPSVVIGQIQHHRRNYAILRAHIQKVSPHLEVTSP